MSWMRLQRQNLSSGQENTPFSLEKYYTHGMVCPAISVFLKEYLKKILIFNFFWRFLIFKKILLGSEAADFFEDFLAAKRPIFFKGFSSKNL